MPVVEALANDHHLALSPVILANLTHYLLKATIGKNDPYQNGPLKVFQLWL